jgi:hypothetical protein
MQEAQKNSDLTFQPWDVGFVGKRIDDRGKAAFDFISHNTKETISFDYDAEKFVLQINDKNINAEEVEDYLRSVLGKSIIFETTTLG